MTHGRFFNAGRAGFDSWLRGYNVDAQAVLRHKFATLLVSFGLIVA